MHTLNNFRVRLYRDSRSQGTDQLQSSGLTHLLVNFTQIHDHTDPERSQAAIGPEIPVNSDPRSCLTAETYHIIKHESVLHIFSVNGHLITLMLFP